MASSSRLVGVESCDSKLCSAVSLFFRDWLDEKPHGDVLVYRDHVFSRHELAEHALSLQRELQDLLGPERQLSVGIWVENGFDNIALGLALFLLGCCQVVLPIHAGDIEILRILDVTPCDLVVGNRIRRPSWLGDKGYLIGSLRSESTSGLCLWSLGVSLDVLPRSSPRLADPAFITHSSGTTTGIPSPNARSFHRTLSYAVSGKEWLYYTPRRLVEDNLQFSAPRAQLITHVLAGGALCFYRREDSLIVGRLYGDLGATRLHVTPPMLRHLLNPAISKSFPDNPCFLTGTDRVSHVLRQKVEQAYPASLAITYSTSQLGPVTYLPSGQILDVPESVGFAVKDVDILSVDHGRNLKQSFEVLVTKTWPIACVTNGGRERVIVDRCTSHPTGDLLRIVDGHYVFCGRADDVFLFRGILIYPAELEAFLESHKEVSEAVVFGAYSTVYGAVPMGVIRTFDRADTVAVRDELLKKSKQLYGFRGLYALYVNVDIPRNASLKALRRVLAEQYRMH